MAGLGIACAIVPRHEGEVTRAGEDSFYIEVYDANATAVTRVQLVGGGRQVRFKISSNLVGAKQSLFQISLLQAGATPRPLYGMPLISVLPLPRGESEVRPQVWIAHV